jgi:2,5-diamino-6-(ribosylamino)-4(3H)-pyrimidinone 5'-phosphate reductase
MSRKYCSRRYFKVKVILVGATTICGRISPAGQGSRLDRRRLEEFRDRTQASIMGANTLRLDNPEMLGTNSILHPDRIRAIISQSGSVPTKGKRLFAHGPRPVVFTAEDKTPSLQDRLQDMADVIALPAGQYGLSLKAALDYLAGKGVESVLVEGGARLNYNVLAQGVADEILLTVMPSVSGDRKAPAFADGPDQLGKPFLALELLGCEVAESGEIFLQYRIMK